MKKAVTLAAVLAVAAGSLPAQAYEKGDWVLRAGATTIDPDASSDDIVIPAGDSVVVAEADIDDDTQLGIIPVYMIDDTWGLELLAATPFEHDVSADVKGGGSLDAGQVTHLPPTLSVQWYPRGGKDGWQPYIGLGVNYTFIYDEDVDGELIDTLAALNPGAGIDDANLDLDDSFGFAGQVGVDVPFAENWAFNASIWYINIESTAEISARAQGQEVANVEFDVDINPWVYNIGIAYKF